MRAVYDWWPQWGEYRVTSITAKRWGMTEIEWWNSLLEELTREYLETAKPEGGVN